MTDVFSNKSDTAIVIVLLRRVEKTMTVPCTQHMLLYTQDIDSVCVSQMRQNMLAHAIR